MTEIRNLDELDFGNNLSNLGHRNKSKISNPCKCVCLGGSLAGESPHFAI